MFLVVFVVLSLFSTFARAVSPRIRGVFDIGSGSTKFTLAAISPEGDASPQVLQVLWEHRIRIPWREWLAANPSFPPALVQRAEVALRDILLEAPHHIPTRLSQSPIQYTAVATEAFRAATNGTAVAQQLSQSLNIPLRVISQSEEAHLGYQAALMARGSSPHPRLVWDIGGGSQQIVYADNQSLQISYEGRYASDAMREHVISAIQGKNPHLVKSPNPLLCHELLLASEAAAALAREETKAVQAILQEIPDIEVLGIGGVHVDTIGVLMERTYHSGVEKYSREQLHELISNHAHLHDHELETIFRDQFGPNKLTNLALVHGYMSGSGISTVHTVRTQLTRAVLVNPRYW